MLVAGVLCLTAAVVFMASGVRALARTAPATGAQLVLRAVAPTQLAAAVMLAAGGVVALSGQPSVGLLALCVAGALGTVGAGAWQGARYMHAGTARDSKHCEGYGEMRCAACALSCR
jgi:hypothetical protein